MTDDAELLRRYAGARSEPAFTEFVARHLNLVYFAALRATAGNAALAQDVTQAVFTVVARRARVLVSHPAVTGWLHTATRRIAARARRKETTRQRYEHAAATHDVITGGPEHDWARLRPVIDDALDDLDAGEREAILVRFFEGRPFAEMGEAWRISHDAARMRVDRALGKLRVALERRNVSSVSSALATALATQSGLAAPSGMAGAVSGAALAAAGTHSGVAAILSFMGGTKMIVGTSIVAMAVATGAAVHEYRTARSAELRFEAATSELASARSRLAQAEQRRTAAESAAMEADRDSGKLLTVLQAARAKLGESPGNAVPPGSSRGSSPDDPLVQTLLALFPDGVVATLGNRNITVDQVRREIAPQLAKLQQTSKTPEELRQRLYALQNSVIGDLVTRQLDIKEFQIQVEGEAPKHVAAAMIDTAVADRVKEQFDGDQAAFNESLRAQGVTLAQYRQTVEEDIVYAYMRTQQRRLIQAKVPAP